MTLRAAEIVNWNIAWKSPRTNAGKIIPGILRERESDILCLCESHADLLPDLHGIFSDEDYSYPIKPGRRKVALWSRTPWREVSMTLPDAPPGRFVEGATDIPEFDPLRVIGVCVPWEAAHVSTGRRDRKRWEDHIAYLNALKVYPGAASLATPTILLGDINQPLPPRRAPSVARELLLDVVDRFEVIEKAEPEKHSVCHATVAGGLQSEPMLDLPNEFEGTLLSDHRGHVALIRRLNPQ